MASPLRVREGELRPVPLRPTQAEHRLRWSNLAAAVLHAAQAVAILALSDDPSVPVTASFLAGSPPPAQPAWRELFALPLTPVVALFLALPAVFHVLVTSPWGFPRYIRELRRHQNRFRWVEYSMSTSLMVVLIAVLSGIGNVAALLALFGMNAASMLFSWQMESRNGPSGDVVWSPFTMGCLTGTVPWLAIAVSLSAHPPPHGPPASVLVMAATTFASFLGFAGILSLQYARGAAWRRYEVGEVGFLVLNLIARSALAWQVFGHVLAS